MGTGFGYITRQIALAAVCISLGLTLVIWLSQTLRFVDTIAPQGVPLGPSLRFPALMLPWLLSIVLPIAIFVAVLFVYQKLTVDSEIVVLRASGMSHLTLARPALAVAALATVGCFVLTLHF